MFIESKCSPFNRTYNENAAKRNSYSLRKKHCFTITPENTRKVSKYIVIKDEVVVSCEDDTGSSADVPSSTEPTSHVNLSVACLGSSQQPDTGQ
ncbi:hypothetical protein CDAR_394531 [Caerostris darwini]|uniref:Uncharacterized protein n=1 Tax=Caerostris darwini TaxID=1538125 RepID=A0AAV4U169_9ARAC|nr:hypothetical protein CDAR_394531 [Caerostris darwini]